MTNRFASIWAAEFRAFLAFKHSLGYSYSRSELRLRALDRFLIDQTRVRDQKRLDESILSWIERGPGRKPISVSCELTVIRQFYAFLRRRGCRGLREPSWPKMPVSSDYVPYVFTTEEIRKLLHLTSKLGEPFRQITYRTLILVLYCTGLRFGEALRLRLRDVDVEKATLFVVESKGRSRWVPYHRSLCLELKRYLVARNAYTPAGPDDRLFVNAHRTRLQTVTASKTVRQLLRTAGLKPKAGRVGPRPYDLRHAFAVHRLTRWYLSGVDLHSRLPWLSAYMGHDDLLGTETYLTATPKLLALAGVRFRHRYMTAGRRNK
jgi:site-specific recombinase XerD